MRDQAATAMLRHGIVLAVLYLTPVAIAGCGSSSGASSPANASSPTSAARTATRTVTATPTATSTASSTSTASTPSATAACVAADLALSYLGGRGATGHGELGFALRNTSRAPCRTYGYPGVEFLDSGGGPLPTDPTHTTSDFFGATHERPIVLAPGEQASFRLGVQHSGPGGTSDGCVTAGALQAIAPDDTAMLRVRIPGGASECGGLVTVSPVQAGSGALG